MSPTLCDKSRSLAERLERDDVTQELGEHVEGCADCSSELARLTRTYTREREETQRSGSSDSESDAYYDALFRRLEGLSKRTHTSNADSVDAPAEESIPESFGRYRVIARLGDGGQATAWRVVHPDLERELVLKVSRRRASASPRSRERLAQEAKLLSRVEHPDVARVYDFAVEDDRPYLVLEYVRGKSLEQARKDAVFDARRAAATVARLARAAHAAHQEGILHRDIKPANAVLDTDRDRLALIDFGVSLLRDAWREELDTPGTVSGTIDYMAPEQARGDIDAIGPHTDVFGLGGVLHYLLVGRPPMRSDDAVQAFEEAKEGRFDRTLLESSNVPRGLRAICLRALSTRTDARYASAVALAEALESWLGRPRRQLLIALGVAALLATVGVAGWFVYGRPMSFDAAELQLAIVREDLELPLASAVPLRAGDAVSIRPRLSDAQGRNALCFWIGADGRLHPLALGRDRSDFRAFVGGPTGTEVIVGIGCDPAPTQEWIESELGDFLTPWPRMAPGTLISITRERADLEGLRGPIRVESAPETSALAWAERLRERLGARALWIEGYVLPYVGE